MLRKRHLLRSGSACCRNCYMQMTQSTQQVIVLPSWSSDCRVTGSILFVVFSQWRKSWKSAPVVNAHMVDDPTIRQPGFTLPRQQWSLLNRFRTGQGHCGACRKTWRLTDTDLCSCGETQTMFYVVKSCPLTKLNGGLSQLHSADDTAIES